MRYDNWREYDFDKAVEEIEATSMGYTVEEWRQVQAENNKRKIYKNKVERLRKEIKCIEQWLADHPTK